MDISSSSRMWNGLVSRWYVSVDFQREQQAKSSVADWETRKLHGQRRGAGEIEVVLGPAFR
jgi:hypothetical protein